MAGASAGSAIGGWILGLLGLRALVQDLVGTLPRALQYYQQGIQEAWGSSENRSCSGPAEWNHGSLSQATFLLANGHVQMVIALLSALMLWISRGRGERANALQSINQSARLGPGFAKWIEANEEKLHTLLASRSRQGGGGAGRAAESAENAAAKAANGNAPRSTVEKGGKEKAGKGSGGEKRKPGPCDYLRQGNGKGPYRGGAHSKTSKPANDGKDSHHMPADDVSPLARNDGPAIQMDPSDHKLTKSNGSQPGSAKYRQALEELLQDGKWRDAMLKEIKDTRRIQDMIKEPRKYNEAMLEMIEYFKCLERNGLLPKR